MIDDPNLWEIVQDPAEPRCFAIKGKFQYEPGEWAFVWVAREMSKETAEFLLKAAVEVWNRKGK